MTKKKKLIAAALVSAMLVGSIGATSVSAASSTTDNINGVNCSASVSYTRNASGTNNGAVATTNFGGAGTIKATAIAYYTYNGAKKFTNPVTNYTSAGGVSATASADGLGTVRGGEGRHYIKYGDHTWEPTTTIGDTSK